MVINMAKKSKTIRTKTKYVDGFPIKTIIGMLKSPETPIWIKEAWKKKLAKLNMPTKIEKLKKMI